SERSAKIQRPGQGALFVTQAAAPDSNALSATNRSTVSEPLKTFLREEWMRNPDDRLGFQLAMQTGAPGANSRALAIALDALAPEAERLFALQLLGQWGDRDSAIRLLPLLDSKSPGDVLLVVMPLVSRTDSPGLLDRLLSLAESPSASIRQRAREALFSRVAWTTAYLAEVAAGRYTADDVSLNELRGVAVHNDAEIDRLVRHIWGNLTAGTPEEKLAVMRRLNNDLRAGGGDVSHGQGLFKQKCATCHRLFGEGQTIGPDLTNTSRSDRDFLLASLVDPSAIIKRQYLTSTIETVNGQTWNGLIAAQDAASITLIDPRGERRTIPRREIEAIVESSVSLMPEKLVEDLTPQQLRDLFAYVQSKAPNVPNP
ncbi:MAG: hypothetical protein B7Z55_02465, partial [Planctomycetales bacterium 12-60-4]